jgi:Fic family protein
VKPSEFSPQNQVHLLEIGGGLVAFLPPPLPSDIEFPRAVYMADGNARAAVGELGAGARRVQNLSLILGPLRRREAVLSSRIEGIDTEVAEIVLHDAVQDAPPPNADQTEALRYLEALDEGHSWLSEGRPLSLSLLRGLHATLLRQARGERRHPGEFRKAQVFIGNREQGLEEARFVPPPPEQVPPAVDALMEFATGESVFGPLIDAALTHYQFEAIHPFEDGNGRLGRLLIPLQLVSRGLLDRPLIYLSAYFESHRDEYMAGLHAVSTQGAWEPWVLFFLAAVEHAARDTDSRVRRIEDLREGYRARLASASKSTVPLLVLDDVLEKVYVSAPDVQRFGRVSAPTARATLSVLAKVGIIEPGPRLRGTQYWVARELLAEAYER